MRIAFDVDGVVLNSIDIILNRINERTGTSLETEHLVSWDLEPIGVDFETLRDAVGYMYAVPLIEPYDGAVEVLSRIHQAIGEPLLFITGRSDPDSARRQLEALPWNSSTPDMIVKGGTRYKIPYFEEHGVEFIVEDDPEHLAEYEEAGIGVGLMVRPWNRSANISVNQRFDGWTDLEKWFFDSLPARPQSMS